MNPPPLKKFVKGSDQGEREAPNLANATTTGSNDFLDARKAYEEIIGDEPETSDQSRLSQGINDGPQASFRPPLKPQSKSSKLSKPPTLSSLMKYAELNDCERVMDALDQDPSLIDCVDQFGWSMLMVAACAGAQQVVELLLHSGANIGLRDKAGYSCISLAKKRGYLTIAEKILKFKTVEATEDVSETPVDEPPPYKIQLCSVCNMNVSESRKKSHLTSTVHQMSQCSKGCKTHYSISGSNRGYQLMLKNGWDGENGLGPSGSGMKFPPKTTLKRDRKGLGSSKGTARITHFSPNDVQAVAGSPLPKRNENKKILKQRLHREKMVELSLRRELS